MLELTPDATAFVTTAWLPTVSPAPKAAFTWLFVKNTEAAIPPNWYAFVEKYEFVAVKAFVAKSATEAYPAEEA
jgi:hypothetical protein